MLLCSCCYNGGGGGAAETREDLEEIGLKIAAVGHELLHFCAFQIRPIHIDGVVATDAKEFQVREAFKIHEELNFSVAHLQLHKPLPSDHGGHQRPPAPQHHAPDAAQATFAGVQ